MKPALTFAAAALALVFASDVRADTPQLTAQKTTLPNGLELVLHQDKRTPIVTVNVWYHVGSKDEPQGKNGFAHLFEHVMFQGSKHVPEDTYFRFLERAGATGVNGTTNTDRTNYFETVPSNQLELALWLESDRMGFLLDHVDQKTFANQRDVVLNERRQSYENAPYGMTSMFINAAIYPDAHPYHRLTIGTPEDLNAASLDDVKAFFRTWYVPNNATLVIAGDFDPKAATDLVTKYFGPIPSRPLPQRNAAPDVKLDGETRLTLEAGVQLARVYVAWPTPKFFAPGDGELDLLARALAEGKTSRLYKRLVYDARIAQSVSAFQGSGMLGSTFEIVATAQPGHTPEELLKAIDEELAKVRSAPLADAELGRAKTAFMTEAVFDLEHVGSRADRLNTYNQMTGTPDYLQTDLGRYEKASANDVKEAAAKYLPADRRVVATVVPNDAAPISGRLVSSTKKGAGQ